MPLRQTKYGGECPLGIFQVDIAAGGGCYTADTLEACVGNPDFGVVPCNFLRFPKSGEKFDPAVQCQCPANMTRGAYGKLKRAYSKLISENKAEKTKEGFWKFVSQQRGS